MRMLLVEDIYKYVYSCQMMRAQRVCVHVYLHKRVEENKGARRLRGTIEMSVGEFTRLTNTVLYPKISFLYIFFSPQRLDKTDRGKHAMTVISHIKVSSSRCSRKLVAEPLQQLEICFPSAFNQARF